MISDVLKKDMVFLEYVLYHEMLHKKIKFKKSGSRSYHHTKEFKELEAKFYEKDVEQKLKVFLRKQKLKRAFFLD
jgi:predicted SprT family Zn-dependent metalloprotease